MFFHSFNLFTVLEHLHHSHGAQVCSLEMVECNDEQSNVMEIDYRANDKNMRCSSSFHMGTVPQRAFVKHHCYELLLYKHI